MNSSEDETGKSEQEIQTEKKKLIENMIRDEPKLTSEEEKEAARQKQKKADY